MVAKTKCNQKWLQKILEKYIIYKRGEKMINYVSLIMDIEKSRTYATEDRIELQKYMSYCIDKLNELFRENIEHDVTFSAGDELQGLFNDTTVAVMYFRLFEMLLKPVKLRAGIGVGEWTIKIDNCFILFVKSCSSLVPFINDIDDFIFFIIQGNCYCTRINNPSI